MIKLSNISVSQVLYGSEKYLLKLAYENGCYTIEDLLSLMKKYPNYNWNEVNKRIDEIRPIVTKSEKKGWEPEIYEYDNNGIELVDKINKGNVLLLDNPTLEI